MKPKKLILLTPVVLACFCLAGLAQTNQPTPTTEVVAAAPSTPVTAQPAPATEVAAVTPSTPVTVQAAPAVEVAAAPASAPAAIQPVPAAEVTAAAASTSATVQPTPSPTEVATAPTSTPATGAGVSSIPLIVMDDVPLTDAIKNLARQANLNYILDPRIPYGQVGPDGKVGPQPSISIRWENLTAEQALTALLNNYSLTLIDDPKSKIARISVKDPAAAEPLLTKVIQLKYANVSNILTSVQSVLNDKRSKVVGDTRTSQLVFSATEKELDAADALVNRLDTQTKQVLIEAKILETTVSPKTVKGIDWSSTLSKQNITFGNGITKGITETKTGVPTTTTLPGGRTITTTPRSTEQSTLTTLVGDGGFSLNTLSGLSPQTAFLNADGLSVALSFLNNSSDTKTISEPRMVTLDNQKATIDVGLMYPIVNVSAGTANTAGGSQISYSNLTVNLDVTPRITANNFVELKVLQSILRLGPSVQSKVGGVDNNVDSFFTRNLETSVLIPSGNTLVMGGLISDESRSGNTKVPLLGDIPGLGLLFRKDSKSRDRQNLIIFITPTIVQDTDFQPAQTTFLKSTGKEEVAEEWSSWDSGKPRDWSKPKAQTKDVNFVEVPKN